jgi:tetratricopeptide (TPR) repeat protein
MLVLRTRALPALMIATFGAAAGAQKACEIDEGQPGQVARAMLDLQMTQSSGKPEDAAKSLRDAVKLLGEGDLKRNPVGRAFVMGKTLVTWMAQPSMASGVAPRAALGFTTDPTGNYDIIAGIDSAFSIVEASNPDCAAQTAGWRQQKAWVDMVNKAFELSNEGGEKTDSAVAVAKRSLLLFKGAPYAYMVLAKGAAEKNNPTEAINQYKQAVAVSGKDTTASVVDMRRQVLMTLGNYASDLYEAGTGDKAMLMAEAKAAYEALAKDPGTKYGDAARAGQARLATMSGDTTAIKSTYADQLANPGAFSYASLMGAAVTAAKANQTKDAIKLFEAARSVNPQHRDVLYNLARLYLLDSNTTQALVTARQLIAVDPANPDNDQLMAFGYSAIAKKYDQQNKALEAKAREYGQKANSAKAASVQRAYIDSSAKISPVIKAYADSAKALVDSVLKYNGRANDSPIRVSFTEFTPSDTAATIGGTVANQGDATKSYTLKITFVDKAGAAVSTADVAVGPVDSKKSMKFAAKGSGAGIVAFKYTITP